MFWLTNPFHKHFQEGFTFAVTMKCWILNDAKHPFHVDIYIIVIITGNDILGRLCALRTCFLINRCLHKKSLHSKQTQISLKRCNNFCHMQGIFEMLQGLPY